jgi:phosphoglycerate dehydrogenase-like enzyme
VQHLTDLFKEISKRDITLVNGHGNAYFTAQHAVALLLAVTNKVIPHHTWMVKGAWRKRDEDATSIPLREKTIGLLGYGHVNRNVHTFLSGFNVSFAAVRQNWEKFTSFWLDDSLPTPLRKYTSNELDSFLKTVEILIVSVPLTSKTKGLITMKELKLLGSHGLLVNVARGPVINQKDLYTALKNKKIAGAGLDVWYNYTPDPDEHGRKYPYEYPFHTLDNVVLSPHRGASPLDDLTRWDEVIENITRVATGKECINVVNLDKEY